MGTEADFTVICAWRVATVWWNWQYCGTGYPQEENATREKENNLM